MMKNTSCAIKPSDVNTDVEHWWNLFGNCETEISARLLVKFLQSRGDWVTFTKKDLAKFVGQSTFHLNRLANEEFIEMNGWTGEMRVTIQFIATCYASYPEQRIAVIPQPEKDVEDNK